jgi:hypothetical protein
VPRALPRGWEFAYPLSERQTVIVVHGTFAAPDHRSPPELRWYQPGGSFCREIDGQLEALGSPARTWKHLEGKPGGLFWWSGRNAWQDRSRAARELGAYLTEVARQGWRFHLVAHSHGGNVVLDALKLIGGRGSAGFPNLGAIVFIGTPFLSLSTVPSRGWLSLVLRGTLVLWLGMIALALTARRELVGSVIDQLWWLAPAAVLGACAGIIFRRRRQRAGVESWNEMQRRTFHMFADFPEQGALVLGSAADEAFILLSEISKEQDPIPAARFQPKAILRDAVTRFREFDRRLLPPGDLGSAVPGAIALGLIGTVAIDLAADSTAAASLVRALLLTGLAACVGIDRKDTARGLALPLRAIVGVIVISSAVVTALASLALRKRAWSAVKSLVMGLSGSPYPIDRLTVENKPSEDDLPSHYEDVDSSLVMPLLAKREHEAMERARRIHSVLSLKSPVSGEIFRALREVFTDVDLVHAVYYSHPQVVRRIAEWISEYRPSPWDVVGILAEEERLRRG